MVKFAAIYGRASTAKQGDTIEHQIDMIKEFAKRTNMDVMFDDRFIYSDEGESGFKTTLLQRPAMRNLISDIDKGLVSIVFFKGVSRFARDSGEAITTAKRLSNKGVRVISLEENYDSFRDEPTMFQIFAVMAENESRKTSIRVSLGNKQKARNGLWSGTIPPIGYTKVKDLQNVELQKTLYSEGKHKHSLYPNEYAHIVQKIFQMYTRENIGRKKIVSWLNDNGYKTNKGKLFQEKHIIDILSNPVYIGSIVYGKTRYNYVEDEIKNKKIQQVIYVDEKDWAIKEDAHLPIVDKEIFDLAQKKMNENKQNFAHPKQFNAAKHPLTGILKCGLCGGNMICQKRTNKKKDGTKIEYRYYVCSTYHKQGRNVCPQANVNADRLEEDILKFLDKKFKQYENFNDTNKVKEKDNKKQENINDLQQIDLILKKKMNAAKTLLESREFYDIETFIELNKEIQDEIKKLRNQKMKLEEANQNLNNEVHLNIVDLIQEYRWNRPKTIEDKRDTFHHVFERIEFQDNMVKKIRYNQSLPL